MDGLSGSLDDEMGGPDGNKITEDDLMLLADLFYLPFEHGEQAISLLEDVRWLRRNAPRLIEGNRKLARNRHGSLKDDSLIKREWQQRAKAFEDHYNRISRMCLRITNSTNKILVYELFPYFWDVKGILSLLNTFIKWLGSAPTFGKNPFLEDSQEPWLQRGGLFAEFQRLLPLDVYSNDPLFVSMPQEIPSAKVYTIRPYLPADERDVYEVCRRAGRDLCPKSSAYRDLIGDCLVGGFLALSADFCFVLEDDRGEICGYVACAPNAKSFKRDSEVSFRTELRKKYPNSALALEDVKEDDAKSIRSLVEQLHLSEPDLDESVQKKYPGLVRIGLLDAVSDPNIAKRLLACALSALKLNGVTGVHVPVDAEDRSVIEFFTKLGFVDLPPSQQVLKDSVVMARSM